MSYKKRKAILLILASAILICAFLFSVPKAFSLYESDVDGNVKLKYAYYVLKTNYFTDEVKLGELVPRNEPYTYFFTVSNYNGTYKSDVDLEYDLSIRTTTNLPLTYELYLDEEYTDDGASNIITSSNVSADSYGTYFMHIETPKQYFSYSENQTYTYELVVYFPASYIDSSYQDIAESIEITIDSRQIIPPET